MNSLLRMAALWFLFLAQSSLTAYAQVKCEKQVNVLLDAWGLPAFKVKSTVSKGDQQVTLDGIDMPTAKTIVVTRKTGSPLEKDVVVTLDKSSCLMSSSVFHKYDRIGTSEKKDIKPPMVIGRDTCRKIFQIQQSSKWSSNNDQFYRDIAKQCSPMVKAGYLEEAFTLRVIPNCGQTPSNAGAISDRIGAIGFLSWKESNLKTYFEKKDSGHRNEGMNELMKSGN